MADENPSSFEELVNSLKEYFNIQKKIIKLEAAEKASEFFSEAISAILIIGSAFAVFFFLSFALAYALSDYFGSIYLGFLTVAGLYLLMALIFIFGKEKLIKTPLMNMLIKNFFKNGKN
jgi:hypothetical protein